MKVPILFRNGWLWAIFFLAGLLFFLFYQYPSLIWAKATALYGIVQEPRQLKELLTSFGPYAPLIFILVQVSQVIVAPIPGGPIEFLGGYFFGALGGFVYSMIGMTLGAWGAFSLARAFEKWAVEKFVSPEILKKFDYLVGHQGVILSFLLFLIPCFPKDALCYILGLTPMHVGIFLVISTIGRAPGTIMATLQGAKACEKQYVAMSILLVLSTLVIVVFYVYREEIHQWIRKMGLAKDKSQGRW